MKGLSSIGEIRESIQVLETPVIQWMNLSPPERIQQALDDGRKKLQYCQELCDTTLKIALIGEGGSNKTGLLNAILDTAGLLPEFTGPGLGNILEIHIGFGGNDRGLTCRKSNVEFFGSEEAWEVLNNFFQNLSERGFGGLGSDLSSVEQLSNMEESLEAAYQKAKNDEDRYNILATLEFVVAIRNNDSLISREQGLVCNVSRNFLTNALQLKERGDLDGGFSEFQAYLQNLHNSISPFNPTAQLTDKNIRTIFPLIKKVVLEVETWGVPFGLEEAQNHSLLSFVNLPEMDEKYNTAKHRFLSKEVLEEAQSVMVVLNGHEEKTNSSSLSKFLHGIGKTAASRALVVVNNFDEFQPLPTEHTAQEYYEGGFSSLLSNSKNLVGANNKAFHLYLASPVCYLCSERMQRTGWKFGDSKWFSQNKNQTTHSLFKRTRSEFERIIYGKNKLSGDMAQMKSAVEKYIDNGGISALRQDIVSLAKEKGEKVVLEKALKEFRATYRLLDNVAPSDSDDGQSSVSNEVSFAAQDFYRSLELAVADALPGGESEYKSLKIKEIERDYTLWEVMQREIASQVVSWPEWFAILNQSKVQRRKGTEPKRKFGRYNKLKKDTAAIPEEFKAFDERFTTTAETICDHTLELMSTAITYSVERFQNHPDYQQACESLQSVLKTEELTQIDEALPLLDAWNPVQMVEEAVIPEVLEKIADEIEDVKNISYPYDGSKPCFWNLVLVIRIQVQLLKTLRDKISRLVAAAETQFESFFVSEVLRSEILPLVRSCLNDTSFLASVAHTYESDDSDNTGGLELRRAVNQVKEMDK